MNDLWIVFLSEKGFLFVVYGWFVLIEIYVWFDIDNEKVFVDGV